jgi:hypothetical protein
MPRYEPLYRVLLVWPVGFEPTRVVSKTVPHPRRLLQLWELCLFAHDHIISLASLLMLVKYLWAVELL